MLSFKEIASVTLILFSVIDILGSIPVIIDQRKKSGTIKSGKATLVAGILMILFLFFGEKILNLFGIDVASFAIAGAIIILIIGLEMVLDRSFFKEDPSLEGSASIVPLAFPLIAGAGSLTTILSLKAVYGELNIFIGIIANLAFVYLVLKTSVKLEEILGKSGLNILRKVFGIILLSLAIKLFKENLLI